MRPSRTDTWAVISPERPLTLDMLPESIGRMGFTAPERTFFQAPLRLGRPGSSGLRWPGRHKRAVRLGVHCHRGTPLTVRLAGHGRLRGSAADGAMMALISVARIGDYLTCRRS